ncbi:MAG: AMP-binding protein [Acidiferrobacterales bacterium]
MTNLALLKGFEPADIIAWRSGEPIKSKQFLDDVAYLAERLPNCSCAFNLCEDRYHFVVGFAAALVRGQTNLLPPSEAPQLLRDIAKRYDNPYCLIDKDQCPSGLDAFRYPEGTNTSSATKPIPAFVPEQLAAVAFTSGSTGEPQANPKTWGSLVIGAAMAKARFISDHRRPRAVVGTVPPQHMYGLETTVLLPIQSGFAFHSSRPFFPEDVRRVLEHFPAPRILVTTPAHIRACVSEHTTLPELAFIISATAPLPRNLAQQAEEMFGTEVLEIYGCTEAGSIASRRTVEGDLWRTYDGLNLFVRDDHCFVDGSPLSAPVELADVIQLRNAYEFSLHGRAADMVNIAGKRASLGDLNHKLNEIDGVNDGVFLMPDEMPDTVTRLVAFVVASGLSKHEVLAELRQSIDPVFLPRPLYMVDVLPRTATGKLPRARLLDLASRLAASEEKAESA